MSLPVRGRGLKVCEGYATGASIRVAPRAGAWVERITTSEYRAESIVAPRAGAWVES